MNVCMYSEPLSSICQGSTEANQRSVNKYVLIISNFVATAVLTFAWELTFGHELTFESDVCLVEKSFFTDM